MALVKLGRIFVMTPLASDIVTSNYEELILVVVIDLLFVVLLP